MHWCWGILEIKGGEGGRLIYLIKTIVCLHSRSECNIQSSVWTCTLLSLLWISLILHGVIPTLWSAQVLPLLIEVRAVHIPWSAHLLLHSPVMLWPLHCVLFSGLHFLSVWFRMCNDKIYLALTDQVFVTGFEDQSVNWNRGGEAEQT